MLLLSEKIILFANSKRKTRKVKRFDTFKWQTAHKQAEVCNVLEIFFSDRDIPRDASDKNMIYAVNSSTFWFRTA